MARKQINIRAGFDLAAFSTSSQNLERSLKQTASKMKSIGTTMSMSITAPLVAMGGLAVKTFASFEQSMAKVNAVSGATGAEFQALNKLALDLGSTTRFTAAQVSDLMLNYSKLGFSAGEIEKITGATLNLALATGEDLAKSAEVAGSTLRAFGLDASEMLRVTDVMAKSFSSSALDLDRFSESMKYVAPVAAAAGISLEEASAMLAILANNGIKGSQAGTSLRRIITDLGATGGNVAGAIEKLAKKGLGLGNAMDEVGRTAQTALIVLGKGIGDLKPLTGEFENAAGSAEAMAAIMDNTLEGAMFRMKSAIEGVAISFGEKLAPALNKITVFVGEFATYLKNLDPETKNLIIRIAGVLAVLGPLAVAVGVLSSALAFLITPMSLVVAGVGGLLFVLTGGINALSSTKKQVKELSESMKVLAVATKKSTDEVSAETDVVKSYFDALRETNQGSKEREQLINTINATYGTTLKNLEDETAFVKQLDSTYTDLIASLKTKIKLSLKEDALTDLIKIEEGINSVISTLQQRLPDQKSMGAWKQMNNALNEQYILLDDNRKAQDAILNESFFSKIGNEATKATGAIGGVTNELEKIKQLGIDFTLGIAAANLQTPAIDAIQKGLKSKGLKFVPIDLKANLSPEQLREELTKLEKSIYEPVMVPIDLKPIEITQELFDQQAIAAAKKQAADLGEEMGDALSSGLKSLATEGLTQFGDFLGTVISGGDMTVKDFGKGLLDSLGSFMGQFGEAMIAMGIAQVMLDVAIKSFNPALAIIGGVALVAAGAAISNLSKKGMDTGGGSGSYSPSGGGGFSSMSGIGANMQPIVLDTRISGRDMIITQGRESQFKR